MPRSRFIRQGRRKPVDDSVETLVGTWSVVTALCLDETVAFAEPQTHLAVRT